ncbi:hypothetical protein D3C75_822880 [compost metagenome]
MYRIEPSAPQTSLAAHPHSVHAAARPVELYPALVALLRDSPAKSRYRQPAPLHGQTAAPAHTCSLGPVIGTPLQPPAHPHPDPPAIPVRHTYQCTPEIPHTVPSPGKPFPSSND